MYYNYILYNIIMILNLYKKKYLKYKEKYLIFKKQNGGLTIEELIEKSNVEVANNDNEKCPNSYYNYTGFEPGKVKDYCDTQMNKSKCFMPGNLNGNLDGIKCLTCLKNMKDDDFNNDFNNDYIKKIISKYEISNKKEVGNNKNFNILKSCNKIQDVQHYFKEKSYFTMVNNVDESIKDDSKDLFCDNTKEDIEYFNNKLLDSEKYFNDARNDTIIKNKDLICLEGNFLYVDENCKVGSGNITSCLFMVIKFTDNSSFVCHMNGMLSNLFNKDDIIGKEINYIFSNDNCFDFINNFVILKKVKIEKIFLVGAFNFYFFNNTNGFLFTDRLNIKNNINNSQIKLVNKIKDINLLFLCNNNTIKDFKDRIKNCLNSKDLLDDNIILNHSDNNGNYIYSNNNLYRFYY